MRTDLSRIVAFTDGVMASGREGELADKLVHDKYGNEPIAAAVFGATLGFAALVHLAMVRHVLNKEFVRASTSGFPRSSSAARPRSA